MARHRKLQTDEQEDPGLEISSMIDCCFLPLIYFLVATSLVSEKKFDMALPSSSGAASSSNSKPFNIKITEDNAVWWEDQSGAKVQMAPTTDFKLRPGDAGYYEERDLAELVGKLRPLNDDPNNPKPLVLTASPFSKHQSVMDVMSALTQAGIKAVSVKCEGVAD
jgi:biopolymer transport protein ExbD